MSIYGNHEHRGEDAFIKAQFEIARLKAEVDRLKLDYYENKTGEVSATIVQTFNTETGEADYVVSLDDYKKMADMFNAEFLRLKAQVERLTKAGDAMAEEMLKLNHPHASIYLWCKAKEGKQP